jgi:hypothetical protein
LQGVVSELGPFDVILDDGGHMTSHMVKSSNTSSRMDWRQDIHSNYWKGFRDSPKSFVDFTKWLIDAMHAHYQIADNVELDFRMGDSHRLTEFRVPLATTLVEKVEFYDSIAAIHRAKDCRELPTSVWSVVPRRINRRLHPAELSLTRNHTG